MMLRTLAALAALCLTVAPGADARAQTSPPEPIRVMILGTYHMDNPGRDMHNARIDPMTTAEKQVELAAVAEALARFEPTAIAIESVAPDPSTMLDAGWPSFRPENLLVNSNERVQLGYRLAARVGIDRVYAIDEVDREGQPTYFPINPVIGWAQANGKMPEFLEGSAQVQAWISDMEARQSVRTVQQLLAEINAPDHPMVARGQTLYYAFMSYGAGDDQPGADLNSRWYARNAQIFARLVQVARPGDRIVVIYGAGHVYWLRQMVEMTPGFELVEPTDYLSAD